MRFDRLQLLRTMSFVLGSSFIRSRDSQGIEAPTGTQATTFPPAAATDTNGGTTGGKMERVTGIGGLFFRAHDPKALASWYQQHLGVSLTPSSEGDPVWEQEAGPTAFTPFPETTKYFGDANKVWMVNFRVRDLEKWPPSCELQG